MDGAEPDADLVEQARIVPNCRRNHFDTRTGGIQTIGNGGIDPDPPHGRLQPSLETDEIHAYPPM